MSLKKALVALLVATMVLGSIGTAYAGFSDTAGTTYADAAERLNLVGILTGFPDGSFKPGDKVTRGQMAAVTVRALGLAAAADYSKVDTKFADVKGDHWAAGFINVAADQGIINGYPDGTFKAEAEVTYAEVLAMLVRVLGYDPSVKGTWPTNYIVKAADVGISKDVAFSANTPAVRGDIALFTDKSLDKPMMIQVGYGDNIKYVISGTDSTTEKSLFADKLSLTQLKERNVTGTPALNALKPNQITVDGTDGGTFKVAEGVNPDNYAGLKITGYKNKDGVIVALKTETSATKIVTGTADKWDSNKLVLKDGNKYEFANSNVVDTVYKALVGYRDLAAVANGINIETGATKIVGGDAVKLVLNSDGKVAWFDANRDKDSVIVKSVDSALQTLTTWITDIKSTTTYTLKDKDVIIVKGGSRVKLADIKADDVVQVKTWNTTGFWINVASGKSSGALTATEKSSSGAAAGSKLTIGGTVIKIATPATFSTNNNSSTSTLASTDDLKDVIGKDVSVLLNSQGEVRHLTANVGSSSFTAVVTTAPAQDGGFGAYKISVFKLDGTKVTYEFVNKDAFDTVVTGSADKGDIVKITLDSNGKIDKNGLVAEGTAGTAANQNKDNSTLTIGSTEFRVTADTVLVDVYKNATAPASGDIDPKVVAKSDVLSYAFNTTNQAVVYKADGANLTYVAFTASTDATSPNFATSQATGVVVSRGTDANGGNVKIVSKGTEATYKYTNSETTSKKGDVVYFTTSGGEVNVNLSANIRTAEALYGGDTGDYKVVSVDSGNNQIKLDQDEDLSTTADQIWVVLSNVSDKPTYFYDNTGTYPANTTLGSISAGWLVKVYKTSGLVDVVVVTKH